MVACVPLLDRTRRARETGRYGGALWVRKEGTTAVMNQAMTWISSAAGARAGSGGVVDDGDLVGRARAGDPVAFERLFERYHAPVLNYLHRMVGDRALAEDLTQDAFVKAYRALPSTRPDLAFKAWLYRIATNTAISHLRRRKLVRWVPFLAGQDLSSNESVERSVGRKHDVEQVLAQLPQHYASVLLLRHYQGLSLAETAQALDITENAAKLRLFRARKAFAAIYAGPVGGDDDGEVEDDR
jgi:RNA polymerase sigma-70 factor (ECF subfamily)